MDETGMDYGVGDGEGLETRYHTVYFCKLGGGKAGATEGRRERLTNQDRTRPCFAILWKNLWRKLWDAPGPRPAKILRRF